MRKLVFGISSMLLLGLQAYAQTGGSINASPSYQTSVNTSTTKSVTINGNKVVVNDNTQINYNNNQDQDDPVKAKTFSKSFSIGKTEKVSLSNQFGSMTIKVWDKNEVKVDADIKAYANTESEAQKLLDETTIDAAKNGDGVSFKTSMGGSNNGNWGNGNRNGKKWRREVKVNYIVYLPASVSLSASLQYGNMTVDDLTGPTSLKVQYGNLTTGDLKNANNYINVQYGKTNLQNVNAATIKHQYGGGLVITSIGNIDIDAQYISVNITTVRGNAKIEHQYGGGINIGSIGGTLDLDAQYIRFKLGTLRGNAKAKVQYGGFTIDNIENGSKAIDVDAQYSGVVLGFTENYNADFATSVSYASFNYGTKVTAKRQRDDDDEGYASTKSYVGQIGKGGIAKVSVKNQYSSITFK